MVMVIMYKAYKFRIYPNYEQRILLNKSFGCVRFVYNYYLDKAKEEKNINAYSYIKDYTSNLKYQHSFLQEVDSILIRKSIFNLEDSFNRYFKLGYGYPKYKNKNSRNSYTHNITKKITDNYEIITCEKLNTINMIEKKNNLSKKILDATFYEIIRQLQYKCKYKGKYFYQIDTYYPSSRTCSVCGNIDNKYKDLKERKYYCSKCDSVLDRDLNASINIMFEGLKLYMNNNLVNI